MEVAAVDEPPYPKSLDNVEEPPYPKSLDNELLYPESVENIEPPCLGSLATPYGPLLIPGCGMDTQ